MNPRVGLPAATCSSFSRLIMPANTGVAAEVPLRQPYDPKARVLKLVDRADTSGVALPEALNNEAGGKAVVLM